MRDLIEAGEAVNASENHRLAKAMPNPDTRAVVTVTQEDRLLAAFIQDDCSLSLDDATSAVARHRIAAEARVSAREEDPIDPPENGEPDPQWRAIKRAIDQFAGRVPSISKHRATNNAHIAAVVARLDAAGDAEAADTIVWQCWFRALDRERERFLLADARDALHTDGAGS